MLAGVNDVARLPSWGTIGEVEAFVQALSGATTTVLQTYVIVHLWSLDHLLNREVPREVISCIVATAKPAIGPTGDNGQLRRS